MWGSRPARGLVVAVLGVLVVLPVTLSACSTEPTITSPPPNPTTTVAAETDAPTPDASGPGIEPTAEPSETGPAPSEPAPDTGIVPGSVDRTSIALSVAYDVKALLSVATGKLETATLLRIRNDSGGDIDRLELNTVAAKLGGLQITEATVDDSPVKVRIEGQTLVVPLGGILPNGSSTNVRIGYRATLRAGDGGSDWMFSRAGGMITLHRWIPWVSRTLPFDRPNDGDPFLTPSSPEVDVELVTDEPMDIAAPTSEITQVPAGSGKAWAFSIGDVRDVTLVLAPNFNIARADVKGIPIRVFTRSGSFNEQRLLALAGDALRSDTDRLGVAYPWASLAVVETQGGEALEAPGMIWVPRTENSINREYLVHHAVAQQWFSGLVGSNQQAEPFADEAIADFLARSTLGLFRGSSCPSDRLDRAITGYSGTCYYETINVQGGRLIDDIRERIGAAPFWAALKGYLEANRFGIGGTKQLLEALRTASDVNILPLLRARFPSLY
jgi:hypothetical protein